MEVVPVYGGPQNVSNTRPDGPSGDKKNPAVSLHLACSWARISCLFICVNFHPTSKDSLKAAGPLLLSIISTLCLTASPLALYNALSSLYRWKS